MSKLDRRSFIGTAVTAGIAAVSPAQILASLKAEASPANENHHADLVEARRLIGQLIAIDTQMSAAEEAHDTELAAQLEEQHSEAHEQFVKFADAVLQKAARTWHDIVARAELAGYMMIWNKPRSDWPALVELVESDPSSNEREPLGLVAAVLYLAARDGGQVHA
jgi:hypothetical protein